MDAPYDFNNAVTDDVSLYATYVDENDFDTLSKSTNNLVATSFYDTTLTAGDSISFNSDAVTYKTVKNATLNYDNTVKLAAEAGTQFGVYLGDKKINATGIVTTYFTVKFTGVANGEAFFMVDGKL